MTSQIRRLVSQYFFHMGIHDKTKKVYSSENCALREQFVERYRQVIGWIVLSLNATTLWKSSRALLSAIILGFSLRKRGNNYGLEQRGINNNVSVECIERWVHTDLCVRVCSFVLSLYLCVYYRCIAKMCVFFFYSSANLLVIASLPTRKPRESTAQQSLYY